MQIDPAEEPGRPKFSLKITVKPEDIDEMNHVNNIVYLRWAQQVAAAHWNRLITSEMQSKYQWVALRHEIDYLSPAFLGDELVGQTWVNAMDGVKSIRHVEFYRGEKCLAKAITHWCLLDASTLKPKRIGQDIKVLFGV